MFGEWNMRMTSHPGGPSLDSSEPTTRWVPPRRGSVLWLQGFLFLLALFVSNALWATGCSTLNGNPKTFTLVLPGSTIMVPRDMPVGSTIAVVNGPMLAAGSQTNSSTWIAQCNTPNGTVNGVLTSTPWPQISPGLYGTNVAGIGVRIQRGGLTIPGSTTYTIANFPGATAAPYGWYWFAGPSMVYTFVKTGLVTGGSVKATDIPNFSENFDGTTTFIYSATSGQITFSAGACTTPDVPVTLKPMPVSSFAGIGSTGEATRFVIAVNGCPPGLNSIQYSLNAASGVSVLDAQSGVIGLGNSSSATGVGLQISDANNHPVELGALVAATGYNSGLGGVTSTSRSALRTIGFHPQ
ncbi:hypothetical protein DYST_02002 [Dyella terrae]|nr:hypothetical protein DYST_02002 [Dyella terrae]